MVLGMKYPAELYRPSPGPYRGLDVLEYYLCDRYKALPVCPEWTMQSLAETEGFEPSIQVLARMLP